MDVCKCNDEDVTWIEVAYSDEGWAIPLDVPHEDATDEP